MSHQLMQGDGTVVKVNPDTKDKKDKRNHVKL
jgi:hypothetical protein